MREVLEYGKMLLILYVENRIHIINKVIQINLCSDLIIT